MQSEWIDVKQELPPIGDRVLTFSKHDWGTHTGSYGGGWDQWMGTGGSWLPYVTHWMPLPPVPSTDKESK